MGLHHGELLAENLVWMDWTNSKCSVRFPWKQAGEPGYPTGTTPPLYIFFSGPCSWQDCSNQSIATGMIAETLPEMCTTKWMVSPCDLWPLASGVHRVFDLAISPRIDGSYGISCANMDPMVCTSSICVTTSDDPLADTPRCFPRGVELSLSNYSHSEMMKLFIAMVRLPLSQSSKTDTESSWKTLQRYITHRIHVWYIYANIGGILMVNVTIYSIHGSYG